MQNLLAARMIMSKS